MSLPIEYYVDMGNAMFLGMNRTICGYKNNFLWFSMPDGVTGQRREIRCFSWLRYYIIGNNCISYAHRLRNKTA